MEFTTEYEFGRCSYLFSPEHFHQQRHKNSGKKNKVKKFNDALFENQHEKNCTQLQMEHYMDDYNNSNNKGNTKERQTKAEIFVTL